MSIHGGIVRATGGVSTNEFDVVSTNIDEQVTFSTNRLQQSVDNAMAEFDIRGASELEMDEQAEMNFSSLRCL